MPASLGWGSVVATRRFAEGTAGKSAINSKLAGELRWGIQVRQQAIRAANLHVLLRAAPRCMARARASVMAIARVFTTSVRLFVRVRA